MKHKRKYSQEQRNRVVELSQQGLTYSSISSMTGVNQTLAVKWIYASQNRCGCGKPLEQNGRKCCNACLESARKRALARTHRLRKSGMCISCGKPADDQLSKNFCKTHADNRRKIARANRKKWSDAGLCTLCGKERLDGYAYCPKHVSSHKVYGTNAMSKFGGHRRSVLERDGYKCIICGSREKRLHIHHIIEGIDEMDNLVTLCHHCHFAVTYLYATTQPDLCFQFVKEHPRSS